MARAMARWRAMALLPTADCRLPRTKEPKVITKNHKITNPMGMTSLLNGQQQVET